MIRTDIPTTAPDPLTRLADDTVRVRWMAYAACRNEDPEMFFPSGPGMAVVTKVTEALAICRRCPVTEQCGQWAIDTGHDYGVWGAMTEQTRARRRNAGKRCKRTPQPS